MWKQDGPDMLYCDGYAIYRIRPVHLPEHPLVIEKQRILTPSEARNPLTWDWPLKYGEVSAEP